MCCSPEKRQTIPVRCDQFLHFVIQSTSQVFSRALRYVFLLNMKYTPALLITGLAINYAVLQFSVEAILEDV